MDLLAAIDLREGAAVRLVQGDFGRQTVYGDPLELARGWIASGVRWLHVVDLDAARTGEPANRELVVALAAMAADAGVRVQTGGGVRSAGDVDRLLAAGLSRVVMGTAALEDPSMAAACARRHPGAVAIGLDYRRGAGADLEAASRGWIEDSGHTVPELLGKLEGAPLGALIVTAIDRDGTLTGPDLEGLVSVLEVTETPVVASGGVGSLGDLEALAALRSPAGDRALLGAVVGKALVDGRVRLEEAIAACEPSV